MIKSSNDELSPAHQQRIRRSQRSDGVADTHDFTFAEAQSQISAAADLQPLYGALAQANVSSLDTHQLRNPFRAQAASNQSAPNQAPSNRSAPYQSAPNQQLQDSLDALSAPLLVLDREGRIQLANRRWRHVYGGHDAMLPERLIGQHYLHICQYLVEPSEMLVLARGLGAVLAGHRDSFRLYTGAQVHTGAVRVCISRLVLNQALYILVEHQELHGAVSHARDTTEAQALQSQLLQAERLADVGRLAASIGHEINNPLTYVLDHLEAVLEAWPTELNSRPDNSLRSRLQEALEGAERVRMIARDLKNHCKLDMTITPVDVHKPLEAALHMANNEIRHRAMLSKDFSPLPPIEGNHSRLEQVFLNLLLNAARGISEGQRNHNLLRIATYQARPETVTIEISDTGPGIMPDALPHIFSPFYSTRPHGEGSGLGLFVCHSIIKQLKGSIHVESVPGQGTTFYIELPIAAQPAVSAFVPSAPISHTTRTGKILIIDDDPRVARALKRILHPHLATISNDGKEAISLCQQPFDLIFCDLQMPRITGMDIYHTIGQTNPNIQERFVFMTGGAFTQQATSFCQQITRPLIGKPFDKQRIHQLVQESLRNAS